MKRAGSFLGFITIATLSHVSIQLILCIILLSTHSKWCAKKRKDGLVIKALVRGSGYTSSAPVA